MICTPPRRSVVLSKAMAAGTNNYRKVETLGHRNEHHTLPRYSNMGIPMRKTYKTDRNSRPLNGFGMTLDGELD
jgi:hypothetical protein